MITKKFMIDESKLPYLFDEGGGRNKDYQKVEEEFERKICEIYGDNLVAVCSVGSGKQDVLIFNNISESLVILKSDNSIVNKHIYIGSGSEKNINFAKLRLEDIFEEGPKINLVEVDSYG